MPDFKPSKEYLLQRLAEWEKDERYKKFKIGEDTLHSLFKDKYKLNIDIKEVLIKVCVLNSIYSTNIFDTYTVANHIHSLKIDACLELGSIDIVNKVANVEFPSGKILNLYSFSSKYCSHHFPDKFPIYDSFVEKMLMYYQSQNHFYKFQKKDLKNYKKFYMIIEQFIKFYNITDCSLKQIDIFLWLEGKRLFPL